MYLSRCARHTSHLHGAPSRWYCYDRVSSKHKLYPEEYCKRSVAFGLWAFRQATSWNAIERQFASPTCPTGLSTVESAASAQVCLPQP